MLKNDQQSLEIHFRSIFAISRNCSAASHRICCPTSVLSYKQQLQHYHRMYRPWYSEYKYGLQIHGSATFEFFCISNTLFNERTHNGHGLLGCTLTLFAALGMGISVPFTKQSSSWGTGTISCGFWYMLYCFW